MKRYVATILVPHRVEYEALDLRLAGIAARNHAYTVANQYKCPLKSSARPGTDGAWVHRIEEKMS